MKCKKLTYKTPVYGSVFCEELFEDSCNRIDFGPEGAYSLYHKSSDLAEFLQGRSDDLAEYAPEDLKHLIVKAVFGIEFAEYGKLYLLTEIYVKREPDCAEYQSIGDWVEGQLSDGWGEGVEQQEVMEEWLYRKMPTFDRDLCEFEEEEDRIRAYYYIHPWSADEYWEMDVLPIEDVELDVPCAEPTIYSSTCKLRPCGGYEVTTVYQMVDAEDVVEFIENNDARFSDEFVSWIKNHGTFGCAVKYYFVLVNEGLITKFLPVLGTLDMDVRRARLFTIDPETGILELDEYMEDEYADFYSDLLNK